VIREIRWRPSARYGQAFSTTISNFQVNLSTTRRAPTGLSSVLASNVGLDDTVVFQGALSLSSAFSGPAGGPKAFDMVLLLSTPFRYDPAAGNLLVDIRNVSGSTATFVDVASGAGGQIGRAFGFGTNVTTASTVDVGADVLKLVFDPVLVAPMIVEQPQGVTVDVGGTAMFRVSATGTPPLTYQWQFSGGPLAGETNATLVLSNVQAAQAGSYSVVVANGAGSVVSTGAVLAVRPVSGTATLVLPPAYENVDAANGSSWLQLQIRLQQAYGAAQFPGHPIVIREIRWRPSARYGQAFSATISNFQVNLSTTRRAPTGLSSVLASNVGPDDTVVFQGALSLSSAFSGPAAVLILGVVGCRLG
jgi:hypothetical protein